MSPGGCSEEHVQSATRAVLDELGALAFDRARAAGKALPPGDPGLLWFHCPNEALQRGGLLYGGLQVGQGVKGGVPDVCIEEPPPAHPEARGVRIELKKVGCSPSPDQRRWIAALERRGWLVYVEKGTQALLARLRTLGWDVDAALARLGARGETIDESGRLVRVPGGARAARPMSPAQRAGRGEDL